MEENKLFEAECEICGKKIFGQSQPQVDHMMRIHKASKHYKDTEIKEVNTAKDSAKKEGEK